MTPPFANTGWPKYRVVTTAERIALQASQGQINNLPVGFLLEEVDLNNEFTALWIRNETTPGSLRQLQIVPQANSVASLGDGLVYVEEYDVPVGAAGPRFVILGKAQRNARLVSALMIYNGVAGPADMAVSIVDIQNANGFALASFEIDQNTIGGTIVPPTSYDVIFGVADPQVAVGSSVGVDMTHGDVGFRLVLTWKVVA